METGGKSRTFEYFDTVCTLRIWDGAPDVLEEGEALCARFHALFNKFDPESDIGRLNRAEGKPVVVAVETAEILTMAKTYSRLTGGAFDVTVGAVNRHWDFERGLAPSAETAARERGRIGAEQLQIRERSVRLPTGWAVDLGGIAKGYISDCLAALLKSRGVTCAAIDLGGNLLLLGESPRGGPWRVGVQQPGAPVGESCAAILAENVSVVTSGVYRRGFDAGEKRLHHILDPRTGEPAESDLLSVTLVTPRSVDGDAVSTACLCRGLEGTKRFAAAIPGAWALCMTRAGELQWFGPPDRLIVE